MSRALEPGSHISHYRVVGPLGAGGMGEVYLAQDLSLERNVALKVLPPHLVRNDERVRRFVLEAKSASSLSHPNIVTIYEIGQDAVRSSEGETSAEAASSPVHFISMELVSGETLAAKIHHEKTDLRTLLGYLAQAAEGLAKAHAAGIVHRDLKPGNIMVSKDGFAKVLDFGLAKLTERHVSDEEATNAPTATEARTGQGTIVGTVGYMSPEQVQAKPVDHRSDIFSFGSILYEAATRRRPFMADTSVETMHKILRETPAPIEEINREAPAELRRLIRRCLAKDPNQRLDSMKTLALELREIAEEYESLSATTTSASSAASVLTAQPARRRRLIAGVFAFAALALAGAGFGIYELLRDREAGVAGKTPFQAMRMTTVASRGEIISTALSADGRYLAYSGGPPGKKSLWMRQLGTGSEAQLLPPQDPPPWGLTFSPDGNYLYYLTGDKKEATGYNVLFQIPTLGGTPRRRTFDVDSAISFAPDGKRVCFRRGPHNFSEATLVILDLESEKERVLTAVKFPQRFTAGPSWSPDGKRCAIAVWDPSGGFRSRIVTYDVEKGTENQVGSPPCDVIVNLAWLPDGSGLILAGGGIEFTRSLQIWVLPYPEGQARKITNDLNDYQEMKVSGDGTTIAAVRGTRISNLWIAAADGKGRPRQITYHSSTEDAIWDFDPAGNNAILFQAPADQYGRLWMIGTDGAGLRQLTSGPSHAFNPRWLPGGGLIYGQVGEDRVPHVWRVDPDGANSRRLTDGTGEVPFTISQPDGQTALIFEVSSPRELWAVPTAGGESRRIAHYDPLFEVAHFSPDGKRIACPTAKETEGRARIIWNIIPAPGGEPVSSLILPPRAFDVKWAPDGTALTFVDENEGVHNIFRQPLGGRNPEPITRFTEGRIQTHEWPTEGNRILIIRWLSDADNLWTVAPDGSNPVRLTDFQTGHMFGTKWMPDGKSALFLYGDLSNDIVLIRNFR